jgi:hypothetical protein
MTRPFRRYVMEQSPEQSIPLGRLASPAILGPQIGEGILREMPPGALLALLVPVSSRAQRAGPDESFPSVRQGDGAPRGVLSGGDSADERRPPGKGHKHRTAVGGLGEHVRKGTDHHRTGPGLPREDVTLAESTRAGESFVAVAGPEPEPPLFLSEHGDDHAVEHFVGKFASSRGSRRGDRWER